MTPAVARSSNSPRDVGEVMAKDVVTCRPGETLGAVASRMLGEDVACTPVLDAAGGRRVVGMLTDRDICTAAAAQRLPLDGITVEDAMRGPVRTCWAVDSLEAAEAIMRAHRVRRLPVVSPAGELEGLISLTDVARQAPRWQAGGSEASSLAEQVVETFAVTSRVHGLGGNTE